MSSSSSSPLPGFPLPPNPSEHIQHAPKSDTHDLTLINYDHTNAYNVMSFMVEAKQPAGKTNNETRFAYLALTYAMARDLVMVMSDEKGVFSLDPKEKNDPLKKKLQVTYLPKVDMLPHFHDSDVWQISCDIRSDAFFAWQANAASTKQEDEKMQDYVELHLSLMVNLAELLHKSSDFYVFETRGFILTKNEEGTTACRLRVCPAYNSLDDVCPPMMRVSQKDPTATPHPFVLIPLDSGALDYFNVTSPAIRTQIENQIDSNFSVLRTLWRNQLSGEVAIERSLRKEGFPVTMGETYGAEDARPFGLVHCKEWQKSVGKQRYYMKTWGGPFGYCLVYPDGGIHLIHVLKEKSKGTGMLMIDQLRTEFGFHDVYPVHLIRPKEKGGVLASLHFWQKVCEKTGENPAFVVPQWLGAKPIPTDKEKEQSSKGKK